MTTPAAPRWMRAKTLTQCSPVLSESSRVYGKSWLLIDSSNGKRRSGHHAQAIRRSDRNRTPEIEKCSYRHAGCVVAGDGRVQRSAGTVGNKGAGSRSRLQRPSEHAHHGVGAGLRYEERRRQQGIRARGAPKAAGATRSERNYYRDAVSLRDEWRRCDTQSISWESGKRSR